MLRFHVDVDAGTLTWKAGRKLAGKLAGAVELHGYRQVLVGRKYFKVHRIIWFMAHGRWPKELDHINGDRSDNRLKNLRKVTRFQNVANSKLRSTNRSGVKGAWWDKERGKWMSQIEHRGYTTSLGRFETKEAAHAAYRKAALRLHGEFARFN